MNKPVKSRGKQHDARAASFRRIAKALRVRARNHMASSRGAFKQGIMILVESELARADIYTGLAQDFDHEAVTLRAMR